MESIYFIHLGKCYRYVPLRYLRPSIIYSVPCDRVLQRAYFDVVKRVAGRDIGNRASPVNRDYKMKMS